MVPGREYRVFLADEPARETWIDSWWVTYEDGTTIWELPDNVRYRSKAVKHDA